MSLYIALACAAVVVLAFPLTVLRPNWVFYALLASTIFGNLLGGYVYAAGNLGMPRAWQPADVLAWLTLVAATRYRRDPTVPVDLLTKCLHVLAVLALFSTGLGLAMHASTALTFSRCFYFVPAALFASRYLVNAHRVRWFCRYVGILLTVMFVLHLLVRLGVFVPPAAKEMATGQMAGERGELSFAAPAYLALLALGVARMASGAGSRVAAVVGLTVALVGIALTETRALYGATVVIGVISLFLLKGRIQMVTALGLGGVVLLVCLQAIGLDLTARFRGGRLGKGAVDLSTASIKRDTWRMQEYSSFVHTYCAEPWFILTGRPIGSLHEIDWQVGAVAYYHSEYLCSLDRFGLVGGLTLLLLWGRGLLLSFSLSRTSVPLLRDLGATVFLLLSGLAANGLFGNSLMHPRAGPLVICFVAALANWEAIRQHLPQTPGTVPGERGEPRMRRGPRDLPRPMRFAH
jgi:hypothetical protein